MRIRNLFVLIIALATLSSCAFIEKFKSDKKQEYKTPEPDYLSDKTTQSDIKKFFNGDIDSFAITQDASGKINGSYTAKISGKWDGNRGTIEQKFKRNDGTQESRTWLITVEDDKTFTAIGHDITMPSKGNKQIGNAIQMLYTLSLPVANSEGKSQLQDVSFEDMMYQVDDKSMIMISNVRKNNANSGKIIASFKKCDTRSNAKSSDDKKSADKSDDK